MKVALVEIAHARSGDKADRVEGPAPLAP